MSAFDYLLINVAFLAAYSYRFDGLSTFIPNQYLQLLLFYNLAWAASAFVLDTYRLIRFTDYTKLMTDLVKILIVHLLLVAAFNGLVKTYYSRLMLIYIYSALILLIPLWRLLFIYLLRQSRIQGQLLKKAIVVGYSSEARELLRFFKDQPEQGYKVEAIIDNNFPGATVKMNQLYNFLNSNKVDEVFCSVSAFNRKQLAALVDFCENNLLRLRLLPEYKGFGYSKLKIDFYGHIPLLFLRPIPLDLTFNRFLKRSFDIVFSLFVIVFILSWLLPIIAIFIKMDSKGSVFFKQKRSGLQNEDFYCLKLRTMAKNSESDAKQAQKGDMRITKVGTFLRKTSLDELPQFFNVLMGDMSVVGPRPHMVLHTQEYSKIIDRYMVRHLIKPGITGLSQVKGFRGETEDPAKMKNRVKVDIFYMEHWSIWLDLKVIFLTVYNVFRKEENAF